MVPTKTSDAAAPKVAVLLTAAVVLPWQRLVVVQSPPELSTMHTVFDWAPAVTVTLAQR